MSIKAKLLIIFTAISIIPVFFLGALTFVNSNKYIKTVVLADLRSIAEGKEEELLQFLEGKQGRATDFSTDGFIRNEVRRINAIKDPDEKKAAGKALSRYLQANKRPADPELIEVHILDRSGTVIASTDEGFIGKDADKDQPYFTNGLNGPYIQDAHIHEHRGKSHKFIAFSAPLKSAQPGEPLGVLMNGYDIQMLDEVLSGKRSQRLGSTTAIFGETLEKTDLFLVNRQGLLVTPSRKHPNLKTLEQRIDTLPVSKCIEEQEDMNTEWADFAGAPVWGASVCVQVSRGPLWTLVLEQGKKEALAPIEGLKDLVLLTGLNVSFVIVLTALATALSISRPIEALHRGTEIIATGNLDARIGTNARDEIGQLSRAFDSMTENLKKVTASRDELLREAAERKRTQEALRISEQKYRNLVDNSIVGVFSAALDGVMFYVNDALASICEFDSKEEMISKGALSIFKDPKDWDSLTEGLKKDGRVDNFEIDIVTSTGKARTVLLSATLSGEVFSGMAMDVTERRRAEEIQEEAERARSQAELSQALSNAAFDYAKVLETISRHVTGLIGDSCIIRLLSEDGRLLVPAAFHHRDPKVMPAMSELLSLSPMPADSGLGLKIIGRSTQVTYDTPQELSENIKPEYRPYIERLGIYKALITPLRSYGRTAGALFVYRGQDGPPFSADERIFVQDVADRAALAISNAKLFTGLQEELARRKNAEREIKNYAAELERSNTDLQQFAYAASHDLQEPLRMISSYIKLLEKRYRGRLDPSADDFIRFAVDGAERLQMIINDLLEYSRIQTQAKPFKPTDTGEILPKVLADLQLAIKENSALVTHGPLPTVNADAVQLSQVFQNLVGNAIKFRAAEPPRIHIRAEERPEEWVFSVEDNGIGIDPQFKDRIFTIFQRLHGKEYPGTGIGLAVCKRIIERHRGRIWVVSEPGKGSTFYFSIPK